MNSVLQSIGANRPETPGTVPDLEALSLVPPGKCYLPEMSRIFILSWDNRVQTSSTTLELWLESLNHVGFMHSAVYSYLVATIMQLFCSFVGGALQQNHNYIIILCMRMKQLHISMQWHLYGGPERY